MAKTNDIGLKQLSSGKWSCRIVFTDPLSGKKIDTTYRRDENNKPFSSRKAASTFRTKKLLELQNPENRQVEKKNVTIGYLWETYLKEDAKSKAKATVVRYTSLWNNHIKAKFETTTVEDLTVADIENFLRDLYNSGLSYSYVEGFIKFFWLVLGIADRHEWIEPEKYRRMVVTKGTKIHMPPKEEDDEDEDNPIEIYELYQISQLNEYFKNTSVYTAFLLGYYLGLRISECFGLMWEDIDWAERTIRINKQLVYEDGCYTLKKPKTKAGKRTIDIPTFLYDHLKYKLRSVRKKQDSRAYRNYEVVMDCRNPNNPKKLVGGDFINRKENGLLQTNNSMKYHAKEIKKKYPDLEFKYHSLRRTHITQLAAANTPIVETMRRVGHTKYDTTMRFYISVNQQTHEKLIASIESITMVEPVIDIPQADGTVIQMKQSKYIMYKKASAAIPR